MSTVNYSLKHKGVRLIDSSEGRTPQGVRGLKFKGRYGSNGLYTSHSCMEKRKEAAKMLPRARVGTPTAPT